MSKRKKSTKSTNSSSEVVNNRITLVEAVDLIKSIRGEDFFDKHFSVLIDRDYRADYLQFYNWFKPNLNTVGYDIVLAVFTLLIKIDKKEIIMYGSMHDKPVHLQRIYLLAAGTWRNDFKEASTHYGQYQTINIDSEVIKNLY